ncbi:MAG: zinc-dependent metalloprotease [Acidimicrobiales bacterium]
MGQPGSSGGGGNFLEQLLGDLLQMMGGGGDSDRGLLARSLAESVATGGQPEANVDPVERIRFEELVRVAEMHVAELTGMQAAGGAALAVQCVGPGGWARETIADWRGLGEIMTAGSAPPPGTQMPAGDVHGAGTAPDVAAMFGGETVPAELIGRLMATMGPMLAAMQLGSAVGHLARLTLGQYELPVPRPGARLLVVPANISAYAEQWSLPLDEVRLWVCLRDVIVHTVLARPGISEHIDELIAEVLRGMSGEAAGLMERLQGVDLSDPDAVGRMMSDPEALIGGELSPERMRGAQSLSAVMAALSGYVEHILDGTAKRLLGARGALAEAWRRRQVARSGSARTAEMLFGIDLGPALVDTGVQFVNGVRERAGDDGLARLWRGPEMLPTPAEITAPGLWLERTGYDSQKA